MPFFSIIIPTYNRFHILGRAILSAISQTFTDFELIIIDDGSTDDTQSLINSFSDNRINSIYKNNGGVSAARNYGVTHANGHYLVFLDSDDTLYPDALEVIYQSAHLNDFPSIVFSDLETRAKDGTSVLRSARNPYRTGQGIGIFMTGAYAIRAEFFKKLGGFDELINFGENAELKIRIEKNQFSYCLTDRPVCIYYESDSGGSKNLENRIRSNEYIIRKHSDYFSANKRVLKLFLQTNAVAQVKMGKVADARESIRMAFLATPSDLKVFLRLILMHIPLLPKLIWR